MTGIGAWRCSYFSATCLSYYACKKLSDVLCVREGIPTSQGLCPARRKAVPVIIILPPYQVPQWKGKIKIKKWSRNIKVSCRTQVAKKKYICMHGYHLLRTLPGRVNKAFPGSYRAQSRDRSFGSVSAAIEIGGTKKCNVPLFVADTICTLLSQGTS